MYILVITIEGEIDRLQEKYENVMKIYHDFHGDYDSLR